MIKTTFAVLFGAALLAMPTEASAAPFSFTVSVNTGPLIPLAVANGPFSLDFQLNGAGANTVLIDHFDFGGGSALGGPSRLGTASGGLTSSVSLSDASTFANELFQQFVPGGYLSFLVTTTTNVVAPTPDAFAFAILDGSLANILTNGIGDALVVLDIDAPSLRAADVGRFNGVGAYAAVNATVPEPASLLLLGTGLAAASCWRRRSKAGRAAAALVAGACVLSAVAASAQVRGPSTASTPYVLPAQPGTETISVLTVDNTGNTPDDTVPNLLTGLPYGMAGIPDGSGAFDNGDGTFTVIVNHELGSGSGVVRSHGSRGAFVSKWIVDRNTLRVVGGADLITSVYLWDTTLQASNITPSTVAFNRFCSADLPEGTAFFNAATGLGSTARIFMNGEEGGATGYVLGHVVTGPDAGHSYVLGRFNLATNGSGVNSVGAWENLLASPFPQDKTIVIGNNDGGGGIMSNALAVYIGTKTSVGSEVERAGLTNGTLGFVRVGSIAAEIDNATARTTAITNGMAFTISASSSTTFSRPEDGAWSLADPRHYYFVTTDQLDQVSDGLGAQIGRTRLWRLTFSDITKPELGGVIDLLLDGRSEGGHKINMLDNLAVNRGTGKLLLQEDVGGAAHNGKIWEYDPATFNGETNSGTLTLVAKHDAARFGDRLGGVTTIATSPYNNDEESSGILDITALMAGSALSVGNPREAWYISSDQAHYTIGITTEQAEGGQLFALHQVAPLDNAQVSRGGLVRDRRSGTWSQQVTITNATARPLPGPFYLVIDGLSSNATLTGAAGQTQNFAPVSPYVQVPVGANGLAPGASASVVLQFVNPSNAAVAYGTRLLNGTDVP